MHAGTDYLWLDKQTDLNNVVGMIMINEQPCSYCTLIIHEIRRLNSDLTTTMNLVVVSSQVFNCMF